MNSEALIVRLKLSDDDKFGEWAEREGAYGIEDSVIRLFERSDVGEFDGHEGGGGFAAFYMYGSSAQVMAAAVLPLLSGQRHRDGSVLIKRFGPPGSAEETTSLV